MKRPIVTLRLRSSMRKANELANPAITEFHLSSTLRKLRSPQFTPLRLAINSPKDVAKRIESRQKSTLNTFLFVNLKKSIYRFFLRKNVTSPMIVFTTYAEEKLFR